MVEVKYNNAVIASLEAGQTATLQCNGKKMLGNVEVTAPEVVDNPLPIEVETEIQMNTLLLLEETEVGAVYKYTGATTARYESGALYVVEKALISFTIDGVEYQAEEGMTWLEWCNSEYNTNSEFETQDNQYSNVYRVQDSTNTISTNGNEPDVYALDVIIGGYAYKIWYACFVAGTPVLMADGTTKPIETVITGDEVVTYNEESGEYRTGIVVNPYILRYSGVMAKITLEDGSYIEMTENHPLYTEGGWKSLNRYNDLPELTAADKVRSINGNYLAITSIEKWVETNVIPTYSLNVEDDDNFFVGMTPVMAQNIDYM